MTRVGLPTKPNNAKAKGGSTRPKGSSRARGWSDPVLRSAVLALMTYALGLIPFYFVTPVHQALPVLLGRAPIPVRTRTPEALAPAPSVVPTSDHAIQSLPIASGVPTRVGAISTPAVPVTLPSSNDSRYAFLLLGYGGAGHEGAYLTDSIMVVIVDPTNKSLTLLSIPRDVWAPLSLDGDTTFYNKINTAYALARDPTLYPERLPSYSGARGPGTFASDSISRLIGLPIRYYVGLDFQGFREMIDAVGGIDVDVPAAFAARYPANDDPSIDASWMIVRFAKGPQHMGGERAIQYARARETIDDSDEGTDYARSRRQRLIMEAFKTRVFEPGGAIQIPRLLSIASRQIDTNYGIPDVPALGQLLLDWKNVRLHQAALSADNFLEPATGPQNTFVLVPSEETHSWAQIQAFARQLWADPEVGVALANTTVIVENDTGTPGLAGQLTTQLAARGYRVGAPVSGPVRDDSAIVDLTEQGAPAVLAQLTKDLGSNEVETEVDPRPGDNQIVINLGRNDRSRFGLVDPIEGEAPHSVFGIETFGAWSPVVDTPTPTPRPPATATPSRTDTSTPTRTATARKAIVAALSPTPAPPTPIKPTPTLRKTPKPPATVSKPPRRTPAPARTKADPVKQH